MPFYITKEEVQFIIEQDIDFSDYLYQKYIENVGIEVAKKELEKVRPDIASYISDTK